MRPLIVLSVMLLCTSGLQGDLTAQEDEPETVVITVDSTNLRFSPSSVTITEGDTVRFFWSGQALPHNAVENNEVFDSGEPARAVDYSFTFERGMNGTYDFVCEPHASVGMVGQIVVEPAPPLNETNATTEEPPMSEDTPALSAFATAGMLGLSWVAVHRRQGNG
ncbi:MAG: cupredoxin domain-containing protein [Poseidonia sp.]